MSYFVLTWDAEAQQWSPQKGVKPGPYTLFGLRKPLRKLAGMGYDGVDDPSVLVIEAESWQSVVKADKAHREECNRLMTRPDLFHPPQES